MNRKLFIIPVCLLFLGCANSDEVAVKESITVAIKAPTSSEVISNNSQYSFQATTSEAVRQVEYFFDGTSIGFANTAPYVVKWTPEDADGGEHMLTAIASSFKNNDFKTEQKIQLRLNLGDDFRGGKIFHLTGVNSGLIASTKDLQSEAGLTFTWGTSGTVIGANAADGRENTAKMASAATTGSQAGFHFKNGYQYNGYSDWYIPSFEEISILKQNVFYVGGFEQTVKGATYWSSSEVSATKAQIENMIVLIGSQQQKEPNAFRIRPIRKF